MLLVLIVTCFFFKVSASEVSGSGNVTAEHGRDANFSCSAATQPGVLQVTWQRIFDDKSVENLATYSRRFGQQVTELYRGKLVFTEASLNTTAITLRNVTWEDEACYICSFNVYPDGSKRNKMCLHVEGISKVNTSHTPTNGGQEEKERHEVFSCTATGKPAPTIEWEFSPGAEIYGTPEATTVKNGDNTVTTSNVSTVRIPAHWTGHVYCVLNKGTNRERRIPVSSQDGNETEGKEQPQSQVAGLIISVIVVICVAVTAVIVRKRLKRKGAARDIP
ncbi:unnamed protein product [Menidia menidia]|uniref:(Atlantic silverside) hypothetical protein n=1 Tax=Menidia menidia TaxID=238744 RepID=A0A8S4B948_9TELE|nr:unnamed protein product [Menidia menidia]